METVLVAGANGKTGREIIQILKGMDDYRPLAMIRKVEQKATFDNMDVATVIADLEGDLRDAVQGVDRVIFAAGSGGHTSAQKTLDVDRDGAINLIDRSKAADVQKFVMLSTMGADNPAGKPEDSRHYFEAKQAADSHLQASFLEYSIVRPGRLTDGEKTNKIEAAEKLGKSGEISRKDLAQVLVDSLTTGIVQDKVFEILSGDTAIELALEEIGNSK